MYSRFQSGYEDIRSAGFSGLPSGRTLSDYKNFCHPKSGWQCCHLLQMKKQFLHRTLEKKANVGGLLFDEVQVKKGLVFDPSAFELVDFTDLHCSVTEEFLGLH